MCKQSCLNPLMVSGQVSLLIAESGSLRPRGRREEVEGMAMAEVTWLAQTLPTIFKGDTEA